MKHATSAAAHLIRATVPRQARTWLRSPSRTASYLLDCAKFKLGAQKALDLSGCSWSIVCHPLAYRCAYQNQVLDPEQNEEFQTFQSYCHDGMFLFDVGAHFGFFSLAAAHFGGKAIAIDPSPLATRIIHAQSELNNVADRIKILRAAISDKNGTIGMLSAGPFSYGFFQIAKRRLKRELTAVPSLTIDRLASQFGPPTHIKIDVEGHEKEVLRGAKATLATDAPILFLELHNDIIRSQGGNPAEVLEEVIRSDYTLYSTGGLKATQTALFSRPVVRLIARRS